MIYKVKKKYKGIIKSLHGRYEMKIDLDRASQEELKILHEVAPHYVDIEELKEEIEAPKKSKKKVDKADGESK